MTDLTPNLSPLVLEDPGVTRLVRRRTTSGDEALLAAAGAPTATSVGVIVPIPGERCSELLADVLAWEPRRVRVEVVTCVPADTAVRTAVRTTLLRSGRCWRMLDQPFGGRVAALGAAAATAEQEFLVVPSPDWDPSSGLLDRIPSTLMAMWRDGADVAVLDGGRNGAGGDAARYLVAAMGLLGGHRPSGAVVLRRWVARWILDDATRALSPADEVADRTRLLGVGILALDGR